MAAMGPTFVIIVNQNPQQIYYTKDAHMNTTVFAAPKEGEGGSAPCACNCETWNFLVFVVSGKPCRNGTLHAVYYKLYII